MKIDSVQHILVTSLLRRRARAGLRCSAPPHMLSALRPVKRRRNEDNRVDQRIAVNGSCRGPADGFEEIPNRKKERGLSPKTILFEALRPKVPPVDVAQFCLPIPLRRIARHSRTSWRHSRMRAFDPLETKDAFRQRFARIESAHRGDSHGSRSTRSEPG
jgi:hypothetical protein